MATTRADLYADEGITRAIRALRPTYPAARKPGVALDTTELVSNTLADLQHWCDARGLEWHDVMHQAEIKYQRDRAGRPVGDDDTKRVGCSHCVMVGAACEYHQEEAPSR